MKTRNYIKGDASGAIQTFGSYKNLFSRIEAAGKPTDAAIYERLLDLSWLESCAPLYAVSPDPNDYVYAIVRALTGEIPNRNGHNFQLDTLLEFNPAEGRQCYRTFEGKPLLINHEYVLPKAAGVLIGSRLVQDGPYIVAEVVIGADKNKNPKAAMTVASGNASFSMGANANYFTCSVCGASFNLDKPCTHCDKNGLLLPHSGNKLGYMNARGVGFLEHSLLIGEGPADPRALHSQMKIS